MRKAILIVAICVVFLIGVANAGVFIPKNIHPHHESVDDLPPDPCRIVNHPVVSHHDKWEERDEWIAQLQRKSCQETKIERSHNDKKKNSELLEQLKKTSCQGNDCYKPRCIIKRGETSCNSSWGSSPSVNEYNARRNLTIVQDFSPIYIQKMKDRNNTTHPNNNLNNTSKRIIKLETAYGRYDETIRGRL